MSNERSTTQQEQKYTPTPEETELNRLMLERSRGTQQGQIQAQQQSLNLINNLLTGQALPGYLSGLPGGISEGVTSNIVQKSLQDVRPGLQASGLFDSGTRAALETRTASDIRSQAEQFNIQNLMQLLNLAVGGQAQVQSPLLTQSGQLSSALAGLRTGTGTSTQTSMNPFLKSFQTGFGESYGKGLGTGAFAATKGYLL